MLGQTPILARGIHRPALCAGFLVHVSKPVEPSELVATVGTVAGRGGEET